MKLQLIRRRFAKVALIALAIGLCGFVFSRQALLVENVPHSADAIVLLGGGTQDRVPLAAALFKSGVAPIMIVTGAGDCLENKQFLMRRGVPEDAITVEGESRNTNENAENTIRLLRAQRARRVVLVTTWYHSRRALATFQFYGPDLNFISVPTYVHLVNRSRPTWYGASFAFREYLKLGWYFVRYGITPSVSGASSNPYALIQ